VHFLSSDQQSRIHCLIVCVIQLQTLNNLGQPRSTIIYLPDI